MAVPWSMRKRFMPTSQIQNDFTGGMVWDVPQHEIPSNAAYDLHDLLINQHGWLYQRGPFAKFSSITGYGGGANVPVGAYLGYYPLAANQELVLVTAADGHIHKTTSSSTTDLGAAFSSSVSPSWAFYMDKTILAPGATTAAAPKKVVWDGATATLSALGGSPPSMNFITIYKSRLCGGGNVSSHPNRLYFSPVPAIDGTWDTTNAWIDCEHNIRGLAGLRNMLLVFGDSGVERIIGDTPPPGTNMDRTTISNVGLSGMNGATCITIWNDNAIYATPTGVWLTNGTSAPIDLTAVGGIKNLWRGLAINNTHTLSCGVYRDQLLIGCSASTMPGLLCFDLTHKTWYVMGGQGAVPGAGITPNQFAAGTLNTVDELVFVDSGYGYSPVRVSPVYSPTVASYADPSNNRNVGVRPQLTTKAYSGSGLVNRKRFTFARIDHELASALVQNRYFETDVSNWNAENGGAITWVTTEQFQGNASMRVVMTTTTGSGAYSTNVPGTISAGTTCTFQMAVKRTSGTGNLDLQLNWMDSSSVFISSSTVAFNPGSGWAVYTLNATAPALTDSVQCHILNASGVAQTVYVDAVGATGTTTWTVTPTVGFESQRRLSVTSLPETITVSRSRVQLFAEAQACQLDIIASGINQASTARIYGVEVEAADLPFGLENAGG